VFLFFFFLFPHLYVDTLQKYLGTTERVHEGLVDIFEKKGWYVPPLLSCSLSLP
jgi:hypothetical protein